jgi:hypothetical protein
VTLRVRVVEVEVICARAEEQARVLVRVIGFVQPVEERLAEAVARRAEIVNALRRGAERRRAEERDQLAHGCRDDAAMLLVCPLHFRAVRLVVVPARAAAVVHLLHRLEEGRLLLDHAEGAVVGRMEQLAVLEAIPLVAHQVLGSRLAQCHEAVRHADDLVQRRGRALAGAPVPSVDTSDRDELHGFLPFWMVGAAIMDLLRRPRARPPVSGSSSDLLRHAATWRATPFRTYVV